MAKKKISLHIEPKEQQRGGTSPPLIASRDFIGMMNGKNFNFKKGEIVQANEVQENWLRKFDAV